MAAAKAFQKKQQDLYNANVQKANNQLDQNMRANAQADAARGKRSAGQVQPPKTPEERQMRRCVSSGRFPASCTGNSLLGAFGQMLNSVAPGVDKSRPQLAPSWPACFRARATGVSTSSMAGCW